MIARIKELWWRWVLYPVADHWFDKGVQAGFRQVMPACRRAYEAGYTLGLTHGEHHRAQHFHLDTPSMN